MVCTHSANLMASSLVLSQDTGPWRLVASYVDAEDITYHKEIWERQRCHDQICGYTAPLRGSVSGSLFVTLDFPG